MWYGKSQKPSNTQFAIMIIAIGISQMNSIFHNSLIGIMLLFSPGMALSEEWKTSSYSQRYEYDFSDTTIVNCIANASLVLAEYNLNTGQNTVSNKDGSISFIFGWSKDLKTNVEIGCDSKENMTYLTYASYTNEPEKAFDEFISISKESW